MGFSFFVPQTSQDRRTRKLRHTSPALTGKFDGSERRDDALEHENAEFCLQQQDGFKASNNLARVAEWRSAFNCCSTHERKKIAG